MNPFFWLLALLFLLPLVSVARNRGKVIRLQKPAGRVLQRSKRDWMWRQFFLSEEYTGSNYQYVGKVRDGQRCPTSLFGFYFLFGFFFIPVSTRTVPLNCNRLPNKALREEKMERNGKSALRFMRHDTIFERGR